MCFFECVFIVNPCVFVVVVVCAILENVKSDCIMQKHDNCIPYVSINSRWEKICAQQQNDAKKKNNVKCTGTMNKIMHC